MQNLHGKLSTIDTTFDCSDKVRINNITYSNKNLFKKNTSVPQM